MPASANQPPAMGSTAAIRAASLPGAPVSQRLRGPAPATSSPATPQPITTS